MGQEASSMGQEVGGPAHSSSSQLYDISKLSCRPATLHHNHGENIVLSDNDSVAERVQSYDHGIVFTAEPVPLGCALRVTLLKKEKGWSGSLSMGFTVVNPAKCTVPDYAEPYCFSPRHWTLWGGTSTTNIRSTETRVYHNGQMKNKLPDLTSLKPGESVAIAVDSKGDLHFFYKDKHQSVVWNGLPMKPLWGFVDLYAKAGKVKVEILHSVELSQGTDELTHCRQQLSQQREELKPELNQLQQQLTQQQLRAQQEVEQLQQKLSQQQQREQQLQQQLSQQRRREQQLQQQLSQQQQREQQEVEQLQQAMQQLQGRLDTAQSENQQLRSQQQHDAGTQEAEFWQVSRQDVQVFEDKILGRGAWGFVAEGKFRGQRVAVKQVYPDILSSLTLDRIRREVSTMAHVRHPNLVLFIASVLDEQNGPMIITEILDLSLRKAYEGKRLGSNKVRIFRDVAAALNYLHKHREPIIHRDVSTANVLLEAMANNIWKAKLSDFGSANLARLATTLGEGAIVYTAPEAYPQPPNSPHPCLPQTAKIDVYSYGVLLCEVITGQFPNPDKFQSMVEEVRHQWPLMHTIIRDSIKYDPDERPTMAYILEQIERIIPIPRRQ